MKHPPDRETLERIVAILEDPVADLVRKDSQFEKLGLDAADYTEPGPVVDLLGRPQGADAATGHRQGRRGDHRAADRSGAGAAGVLTGRPTGGVRQARLARRRASILAVRSTAEGWPPMVRGSSFYAASWRSMACTRRRAITRWRP